MVVHTPARNALSPVPINTWWRHQMETFSALLAICAGNSPVPVNSSRKGQWRGALMFTLIWAPINGWVNNCEAGELRRYRAHYDVIVMTSQKTTELINCPCSKSELNHVSKRCPWPHFYQTRSAWSMDQGSNKNYSPAYHFAPTVTKFCVMWEGSSLPHDTKFGNCRCKIVDSRAFPSWSLIHGLRWSGLIKAEPGAIFTQMGSRLLTWVNFNPCIDK